MQDTVNLNISDESNSLFCDPVSALTDSEHAAKWGSRHSSIVVVLNSLHALKH